MLLIIRFILLWNVFMLFILYFAFFDFLIDPLSNCYAFSISKSYPHATLWEMMRNQNIFMSWYIGFSREVNNGTFLMNPCNVFSNRLKKKPFTSLMYVAFSFPYFFLDYFLLISIELMQEQIQRSFITVEFCKLLPNPFEKIEFPAHGRTK